MDKADEVRALARLLRLNKQGGGFPGGAAYKPTPEGPWPYRTAFFTAGKLPPGWTPGQPPPLDPAEWSRIAKESAAEREREFREREAERGVELAGWKAKGEEREEHHGDAPPEGPAPWVPPGPRLVR